MEIVDKELKESLAQLKVLTKKIVGKVESNKELSLEELIIKIKNHGVNQYEYI